MTLVILKNAKYMQYYLTISFRPDQDNDFFFSSGG